MEVFRLDEADIEYVSTRLDYFTNLYKLDMTARLGAMMTRHQADKQTIAAQQHAIEQLQKNVDHSSQEARQAEAQLSKLSLGICKLRGKGVDDMLSKRNRQQLEQMFAGWRAHCSRTLSMGRRPAGGVRKYYERRLISTLFAVWRKSSRQNRIVRESERRDNELQELREQVSSDYEGQIGALKAEVRRLTAAVRAHDYERESLEERMRQAFARGVCALNKEALVAFGMSRDVLDQSKEESVGKLNNEREAYDRPAKLGMSDLNDWQPSHSVNDLENEDSGVVFFQPIPLRLTAPYHPQSFSNGVETNLKPMPLNKRRSLAEEPRPRSHIPTLTASTNSMLRGTSYFNSRAK